VHFPERLRREQEIPGTAAAEERGLDGEDPVIGAGLLAGQVEGGPDEHVPEAVDLLLVLTPVAEQTRERLVAVPFRGQSP
jgi:hypothetical protein